MFVGRATTTHKHIRIRRCSVRVRMGGGCWMCWVHSDELLSLVVYGKLRNRRERASLEWRPKSARRVELVGEIEDEILRTGMCVVKQ